MIKKAYLQPVMTVSEMDLDEQLMVSSVQTTGLDDDNLSQDETFGDSWTDAMSRRRNVWDDDEEW